MSNVESSFNGLGVDAITGVRLMEWLGVSSDELQMPGRFSRFRHIVDFLKDLPEDTQRFLINKSTRGKLVDKLDHVYEYTTLLKQKHEQEVALERIGQERSIMETNDEPTLSRDMAQRALETKKALARTKDEITIYEK